MKRLIHRILRSSGLHVERHRDAFTDFAACVPDASVVIDGGAYKGTASREFLTLFPRAKVHAFEANPDLATAIEGMHERITVHSVALSNTEGTATFHVPDKAFTGSLLKPGESIGASKKIEVPQVTIDVMGIKPDAIKIDLQGAELLALQGAEKALPTVRAVLCEVNFVRRYEGCALFHEIAAYLDGFGLNFHRFYEVHTSKSGGWQFADALFVR